MTLFWILLLAVTIPVWSVAILVEKRLREILKELRKDKEQRERADRIALEMAQEVIRKAKPLEE